MRMRTLALSFSILLAVGTGTALAAPPMNYSVLDKSIPGSGGNSPECAPWRVLLHARR